jgi:hypothetical protein
MKRFSLAAAAVVAVAFGAVSSAWGSSSVGTYFIGVDGSDTVTFGTYSGLENPNQNRLTLLFHHGNHFHGIGTYSYEGPVEAATVTDTNSNNRLPEGYTGLPPISLQPGSGAYAGTFRSGLPSTLPQDVEYGDLKMRNVHSLAGVDDTIYNSSGGRWNGAFDSAHIHLELHSATPGLKIALGSTPVDGLPVGSEIHVGDGDEMFSVLPTFWVAGDTPIGSTFTAEFQLDDVANIYGKSGRFFLDFQVVPEPAAAMLLAVGGLSVLRRRLA